MNASNWIRHDAPAKGHPPRQLLPFIRWALSGAGPALGYSAIISVISGVVEVAGAMVLGKVIDGALATSPETVFSDNLTTIALAVAFFVILRPLVFVANFHAQSIVVGPNVFNLVLSRIHRFTLGQAVTFFDNDFAGRIAQKEMQTARALTDVVVEMIQTVLFALASVIGAILLLGTLDWRIALGLLVWLVGYYWMIRFFMPRIRARSTKRASARAMVTGQIVDTVTNIKTVKLFAHGRHEDKSALTAMRTFRDTSLAFGRISVSFRIVLVTMAGLLPVLLIGGALLYWSQGLVTAGDIAATGAVSLRLAQMTGWVSFTLMGLYANMGEVEDGMHTLTPAHTLIDKTDAPELNVGLGRIDFNDVSFAYGRKTGGVERMNLSIAPGEKVGIVGASGAGKSTLVSLLLRLYDTEQGQILIDGQNIADVTQDSLRGQIGMVTQETAMFNRTALDNIRYGRPGATFDEVVEAARRAEAHEFILGLQDHKGNTGYHAFLGERGVKLSGGQRQRIALARAILKDAPILILDEATSALDSEVEASIQTALERVMEGKTVLAIAHSLSTISSMDRIIVLDHGRIAEAGTHTDLLALGGLYAGYWSRQSGGFLGAEDAAE